MKKFISFLTITIGIIIIFSVSLYENVGSLNQPEKETTKIAQKVQFNDCKISFMLLQ